MEFNEFKKCFVTLLAKPFIIIFVLCIVFGILKAYYNSFKKTEKVSTPVEKNEIDSITPCYCMSCHHYFKSHLIIHAITPFSY